ncbi:MAG: hypothetical protein P8Y18_00595 [Candidatus Bathyarchaeota archaeon]
MHHKEKVIIAHKIRATPVIIWRESNICLVDQICTDSENNDWIIKYAPLIVSAIVIIHGTKLKLIFAI